MGYKSPRYVCLSFSFSAFNPADSLTYYAGDLNAPPSTTQNTRRVYIPASGLIRAVQLRTYSATATGTAEDITLNIVTNGAVTTAIATVAAAAAERIFANYNMNVPVAQGDYFEVSIVCPAWVTNPEGTRGNGTLLMECG